MSTELARLTPEDLLRLTDEAARVPSNLLQDGTYQITPEQAQAVAQLAAEYRRLRGLVAGQKRPCVLFHGVWPDICDCTPRCSGGRCKRQSVGHYLYTRSGMTLGSDDARRLKVPTFKRQLDGGYAPGADELGKTPRFQPQGLVRITYEQGWTLYAFWDRSGDMRGNSNSVILVEGTYEFADLEALASHALPALWARCGKGLREETPEMYRCLMLGGEF